MRWLLLVNIVVFVGAEVFIGDIDEAVPVHELTAVAGYQAQLPCDITPPSRDEVVFMVLWYDEVNQGQPIYSVDARGKMLARAKLWSDPNVFGTRAVMRTDAVPAKLEIDRLEPTDEGMYRCRVDYRNSPTRNQKVNLTVVVPPEKPIIFTEARNSLAKMPQPFNEGSRLFLLCEVRGGVPPPTVSWYLDNKPIDDTFKRELPDVTVNHLEISRVPREFLKARLICEASNTPLVAPVVSEILLNVNLKPLNVTIANKETHLSALRTYDIMCSTFGSRPEAVITWWKGTHQVKHMARNFAENSNNTGSVLSYVPIIEDDGKHLTCRAENPLVPDSALEDRWRLVIHYAPIVTIKLGSKLNPKEINEGDDVYFECIIKANPKEHRQSWFKDGKELHQNVTAGILLPSGLSLVLQSVTRRSAGRYSCLAANMEGKASSKPVTLEVMYKPICTDGTVTQVVGALKHETISLLCAVQAKPPPIDFHWTFNNSGELMNVPASKFTRSKPLLLLANHWHGSRLNYTPTNDMDYGTVACKAENRIGMQSMPCLFQIIVAGRPYPLHNCTAIQSSGSYSNLYGQAGAAEDTKVAEAREADPLVVKCAEGFDGGLPLTSFELEVYSEENIYRISTFYLNHTEKTNFGGPVFEVPGLEPGRNYRLLLYAVNAKGRSDPVVLEPVTLKGVAMYTTGRGANETTDYSLLVACFAGGVTAVCILIVGVTLTLYRRGSTQPAKMQARVVQYKDKETREYIVPCTEKEPRKEEKIIVVDPLEDDPDVIPNNKVDRRSDIFEPTYAKPERMKNFGSLNDFDYPSPSTLLQGKQDAWMYSNGYSMERPETLSPVRPSTLPVHRTHDIYTRSSRVQESCI